MDQSGCGCCVGLSIQTPVEIFNRPGLAAIAYRVGTHARFKQSMLADLSFFTDPTRVDPAVAAALSVLTARTDDDFAIGLLDAWATVADALTFYQERIANESYLATATERRSLLELARLIGYELNPGVAASVALAFAVDTSPGSPAQTTIDVGTKVQSVPGPGDQAQIFETIENIEARGAWNKLLPRQTSQPSLTPTTDTLLFATATTNLRLGDGILFWTNDGTDEVVFGLVATIAPRPSDRTTMVTLQLLGSQTTVLPLSFQLEPNIGPVAEEYLGQTVSGPDLEAAALRNSFSIPDLFATLTAGADPPPSVYVFRQRAAVFGHNAPDWFSLPVALTGYQLSYSPDSGTVVTGVTAGPYMFREFTWADDDLADYLDGETTISLDTTYPGIAKGSVVVLRDHDTWTVSTADAVADASVADFTLSAKVTQITLDPSVQPSLVNFVIRSTTVFAQSEWLALALVPRTDVVQGSTIELDGLVDGLEKDQEIVFSGELDSTRGTQGTEVAIIGMVQHVLNRGGSTWLTLTQDLANTYVRTGKTGVMINANVAQATHGESKFEILGSGDATEAYQSFSLRQSPLTYVSAQTPNGTASTLKLYVNDTRWSDVPNLYGHGPNEHVFVTRLADDGTPTVQAGDGQTGARFPTGAENVYATFRKGIGVGAMVKAGQLSVLLARPAAVTGVTNPEDATGAQDPETLDEARRNAPLTIRTLDRIVSLRDYEDFARAFAGVAKSLATWLRSGNHRGIFVTVAGQDGSAFPEDSAIYKNLLAAMRQYGDPFVSLRLATYRPIAFYVAANLKIDPTYRPELVQPAVVTALRTAFAFQARDFGQRVALSEVYEIVQAVPGIVAADVTELYRSDATPGTQPENILAAAVPTAGSGDDASPAELLTLDPGPITLGVLT